MADHDAWPAMDWPSGIDATRTVPPARRRARSTTDTPDLSAHLMGRLNALVSDDHPFEVRLRSLTGIQREVLLHLMLGRLNKQIAFELDISEATVKSHVTAVLRRLDVKSRTEAVVRSAVHLCRDASSF